MDRCHGEKGLAIRGHLTEPETEATQRKQGQDTGPDDISKPQVMTHPRQINHGSQKNSLCLRCF